MGHTHLPLAEGVAHDLVDSQRLAKRNDVIERLHDVGFVEHVGLEVEGRLFFHLKRLLFGEKYRERGRCGG